MARSRYIGTITVAAAVAAFADLSKAEMRPSLNFEGVPGLVDMPSGDSLADGTVAITGATFGNIKRTTLAFQITSQITASYRHEAIDDWNLVVPSDFETYNDRSFDLRFKLLDETRYLPAVTLGLQDFIGTGLKSAEYLVATKTFGDSLKVTAGLGWGRLASYKPIGTPFGERPTVDFGEGGVPTAENWFRGPVAPFAGVEWKVNDTWTVKAEYSSDAYADEAGSRRVFDRKSPYNFGIEYQKGRFFRAGIYSLYGSEIGLKFQLTLDPKTSPTGGIVGYAPQAVGQRPARSADPEAYDGQWVTQPDAGAILHKNLARRLAVDGIAIEGLTYTAGVVHLRIRNSRLDAGPQAIGRAARALSAVMPASVELFEIVPVVNGIGASKITMRRSDVEALEHAPGNDVLLRERVTIADAGPPPEGLVFSDELYPKFTWKIAPTVRFNGEFQADLGLRLSAGYEIRPGLLIQGSIYKSIAGNLDRDAPAYDSVLPPVRSLSADYNRFADPGLERLTVAWYARPAEDFYSRLTFGYLEQMHAGLSAELLWKPVDSRFALGVEVNRTAQRDTDGGFGVSDFDYSVTTGHVSAYYDFGGGYLGQLDVGRYLAGDLGTTISIDREFANGWKLGAFATITDVSAEEFGEGSFDKGIRITIPMNWILGKPTRNEISRTLRPNLRDGGARLDVAGRLYETIREYHTGRLDSEWGGVWR